MFAFGLRSDCVTMHGVHLCTFGPLRFRDAYFSVYVYDENIANFV